MRDATSTCLRLDGYQAAMKRTQRLSEFADRRLVSSIVRCPKVEMATTRWSANAHGLREVTEPYAAGDVSFHLGWTLHRAGPNTTPTPRKVHTVIYMDVDMRLAKPKNAAQQLDQTTWTPSTAIGEVMNDPRNPVLYERA